MSKDSPEVQLSFDDEGNRRVDELIESTDRILGMVEKSRAERAEQDRPGSKPLDVPPSVRIHLDARDAAEQEWDRAYDIEAKKWPGAAPEVRARVEKRGTKRPVNGEDIESQEVEEIEEQAEDAARKSATETHASNLHHGAGRTGRLKNPPRPGKGGDKNVPGNIAEIDGERIIR